MKFAESLVVTSLAICVTLGTAAHAGTPHTAVGGSPMKVHTSHEHEGDVDYISANIRIKRSACEVWSVLVNPYEFQGKISPRMKQVEMIIDRPDYSLMKCRIDVGIFIPSISYTVESKYDPVTRTVSFKSAGGDLKSFCGSWTVQPISDQETEVTYKMNVEPGIPIPKWLVRQAVKFELPRTLQALRQHVEDIYTARIARDKRNTSASKQAIASVTL